MVDITYQMVLSTLQTVALIVGITYYLIIMRNSQRNQELARRAQEQAVETRQAQMFMGIYNQMNQSDYIDAWRAFMDMGWSTFEEYMQIQNDPESSRNLWVLGMFYEGLGVLVKNNFVPIKFVAETMTGMTRMYWEKFIPIVEEGREKFGNARWYSETEYLYVELLKYLEEHPELKT